MEGYTSAAIEGGHGIFTTSWPLAPSHLVGLVKLVPPLLQRRDAVLEVRQRGGPTLVLQVLVVDQGLAGANLEKFKFFLNIFF